MSSFAISRKVVMAVAHIHIGRIWLMSKRKRQRASLPPFLDQLLFHHSPPLSPDNSCTTPAAHHSLPNTVGYVNTAHSHTHTHRGRTVGLVWVSSQGLAVRAHRFSQQWAPSNARAKLSVNNTLVAGLQRTYTSSYIHYTQNTHV